MDENNFVLVIVAVVAMVAIIGLLNFSEVTGKLAGGTNVVQTPSLKEAYLTQWECEDNGKYSCKSFMVETTESGVSSYRFWECGDRWCHRLYYRKI